MRAEAPREEPVTVGILNDVAFVHAARGEAAHHHARPDANVVFGVGHDDGFPGGAARCMQAHDVAHGLGEKAERIGVAQVGLRRERQARDILLCA